MPYFCEASSIRAESLHFGHILIVLLQIHCAIIQILLDRTVAREEGMHSALCKKVKEGNIDFCKAAGAG